MKIGILSSGISMSKIMYYVPSQEFEWCRIASTKELEIQLQKRAFDLAVIDFDDQPDFDISSFPYTLWPKYGLLVTAHRLTSNTIIQLLKNGVTGMISSAKNYSEFEKLLPQYLEEEAAISSSFLLALSRGVSQKRIQKLSSLPKRRAIITKHLLSGLTYREVAEKNHISIETVRDHVKKIYREFKVNSRDELQRVCQTKL